MTYLKISDALNDGINNLIEALPDEAKAKVSFVPSGDITASLSTLADICMIGCVGDENAAKALKEAYAGTTMNTATALAKVMEAFIALHKKANAPAAPATTVTAQAQTQKQTSVKSPSQVTDKQDEADA